MGSGDGSAPCSTDSLPVSAPTTSKPPAMATQSENALSTSPNPNPSRLGPHPPRQGAAAARREEGVRRKPGDAGCRIQTPAAPRVPGGLDPAGFVRQANRLV